MVSGCFVFLKISQESGRQFRFIALFLLLFRTVCNKKLFKNIKTKKGRVIPGPFSLINV
jgi:hypothetical protein